MTCPGVKPQELAEYGEDQTYSKYSSRYFDPSEVEFMAFDPAWTQMANRNQKRHIKSKESNTGLRSNTEEMVMM
jgi:hypothetical protein